MHYQNIEFNKVIVVITIGKNYFTLVLAVIGPAAEVMVPKITDDVITENCVFLCDMGSQYM